MTLLADTSGGRLEHEVRAGDVKLGDYLAGLGRVQSLTTYGKRVTLHGEFDLWRASVDRAHRVVVIR